MIRLDVTYENYLGEQINKKMVFSMSSSEILEWNYRGLDSVEKLSEYLMQISKSQDKNAIREFLTDFIKKAYGEPSADGEYLYKNEELSNNLVKSAAYNELIDSILYGDIDLASFFTGVLPKKLIDAVNKGADASLPATEH